MVNKKVMIPDLGGVNEVTVLEILVNIGDAVDYGAVGRRVRNLVSDSRFQLIEGIAERIANDVLQQERRVISVTVCVTKPYAIPDASVSLTITRPRRPVSQT